MHDVINIQKTQPTPQAAFTSTATPMVTDEQLDSRAAPNEYFNPGIQGTWQFNMVG